MRRACWWLIAAMTVAAWSCDDKNELPPEVLRARQQAEQMAKAGITPLPTTRELAEMPRTRLRLGEFPMSVEVPKSWRLKAEANGMLVTLSGLATSGEINIQLLQQIQTVNKAQFDSLVADAKKDIDAKPHPINRVQVKDLGTARLLEQRMIANAFVNGKLPPEVVTDVEITSERPTLPGEKPLKLTTRAVERPHLVKWSITLFQPIGDKYSVRGLTFQTLRVSEYEQDKDFLEKLVASIQVEE